MSIKAQTRVQVLKHLNATLKSKGVPQQRKDRIALALLPYFFVKKTTEKRFAAAKIKKEHKGKKQRKVEAAADAEKGTEWAGLLKH